MDREEKLLLLFMGVAFFGLLFHVATTDERMARDGYLPFQLKGSTSTFWFKPSARANPIEELEAF